VLLLTQPVGSVQLDTFLFSKFVETCSMIIQKKIYSLIQVKLNYIFIELRADL